ncbi:MAG: putative toxin-antitoxin system toxin component, PIN family [Lachnospiraceae bacterium]|nr:putative toxin-antitoxin system toxin component, PIN family [Lachnospiraceae bacterium]
MYVVIDTNVIVSAFLSSKQDVATVLVLEALYSGKIKMVYSDEIIAEYEDVLNRDKFKLDKDEIEKFIGFVVYKGIKKESKNTGVILTDAKDQPFYDLKNVLADTILVTGNIKHFPNDKLIMLPKDFINNYIKFCE